mgnify:CR=1 FL=1
MILKIVDNIPLGRFDVFEIYVNEEKYYLKRKSAIEIDIFDEEITVYVKIFNKKSKKYVFLARHLRVFGFFYFADVFVVAAFAVFKIRRKIVHGLRLFVDKVIEIYLKRRYFFIVSY